ncbi:MAG: PD40 domain-containing protein [Syntrophobacterales bacterium]|nr:PD40 domain-containing protein [Syntrophobacterales bacterium]
MKRKWGLFTGFFIATLFIFFGFGTMIPTAIAALDTTTITGTIDCNLPAGAGQIHVVVFDGPDTESDDVIGETSISAPGDYTITIPAALADGYVFAYWDMDGVENPDGGPVTGDYTGEYGGNPISLGIAGTDNVDITLINGWVINWGMEGVYDTDDNEANGVQNETVMNILQLTTDPGDDCVQCWGDDPWSPDGSRIVYTSERRVVHESRYSAPGEDPEQPETNNEICIMNADGSGFHQLTSGTTCNSHASFTPDGNRIVFQRKVDGEERAEIWIMDADGTNPQNLTWAHNPPPPPSPGVIMEASESKPVVSPDGEKIAFISVLSETSYLCVMDIDGTNPVMVSADDIEDENAIGDPKRYSWSPDSQWILFDGESPTYTGRRRIYKVQPDGSDPVMLSDDDVTTEYIYENWAFWSPDGNHIAYHTHIFGGGGGAPGDTSNIRTLSMMNTDGTDKEDLVTEDNSGDWTTVCGPKSWSPDSKWIAFKKYNIDDPSISSIFLINIDTEDIRQITENYGDFRLWWSPDGGKILFREWGRPTDRDDGYYSKDLLVINLAPWFLEGTETGDVVNETIEEENDSVNNYDAGTQVEATGVIGDTGTEATIVTAKYDDNPTGISFNGDFYDLYIGDPSGILGEIVYTIYFKGDPQTPHWFDGDTWQAFNESDYEIVTESPPYTYGDVVDYDGYVEITLTNDTVPSIRDFSGTAVGLGDPEEDSSSGCFIGSLLN